MPLGVRGFYKGGDAPLVYPPRPDGPLDPVGVWRARPGRSPGRAPPAYNNSAHPLDPDGHDASLRKSDGEEAPSIDKSGAAPYNHLMPSILVVDDDLNLLNTVGDQLKAMGHEVFIAMDGLTVSQKIQQHHPDLLILDFQMPAANGAKVLERLRGSTLTERLPVIFLTGQPIEAIKNSVPASPLLRFLQKPVNSQMLQAAINELLGGQPETPSSPGSS